MWTKLLALFSNLVKTKGGQWLAAVLASVGIGVATQAAVAGPALDQLLEYMQGLTSGGGVYMVAAVQTLAFIKFDIAVTMIVSAYASRAGIRAARAYFTRKA